MSALLQTDIGNQLALLSSSSHSHNVIISLFVNFLFPFSQVQKCRPLLLLCSYAIDFSVTASNSFSQHIRKILSTFAVVVTFHIQHYVSLNMLL